MEKYDAAVEINRVLHREYRNAIDRYEMNQSGFKKFADSHARQYRELKEAKASGQYSKHKIRKMDQELRSLANTRVDYYQKSVRAEGDAKHLKSLIQVAEALIDGVDERGLETIHKFFQ